MASALVSSRRQHWSAVDVSMVSNAAVVELHVGGVGSEQTIFESESARANSAQSTPPLKFFRSLQSGQLVLTNP